ncbi:patatin-like phospholipase family protein [Hymenobacter algoricola]|uniref:Patatin-like phospholipase family protein n=1 Tax=Hymenobacter algoricola TaxID=486267 RepID=A0ABP7NP62_9BACT
MQKIGVALSGGGARGIAHLGVLAALDELQIPVAHLAGVSSGAIAATFYAAGFTPAQILHLLTTTNVARLMRPAFSRYGLLHFDAVEQLFIRHLGLDASFADLQRPLTLVATDLAEGVSVYFSEGPLILPLLASSAVPIVYRPVEYQGRQLVDGGLLNNLPVEPILEQGMRVIGVHCNPINNAARVTNFRNLIERTLHLAINANTVPRQRRCDVLIEPPELRLYRPLGYRRAPELYEIGYRYTMSMAEQLQALS